MKKKHLLLFIHTHMFGVCYSDYESFVSLIGVHILIIVVVLFLFIRKRFCVHCAVEDA